MYFFCQEDNLYFSKLQKNLTDLELNLRILTHGKGVEDIKGKYKIHLLQFPITFIIYALFVKYLFL